MKFRKQAIFHTFPLLYTLTENSDSNFLGNKIRHKVVFYNDPELDDLLFSTGWKATLLRILKNFLFKEKDSVLYILTHFVVYKTNMWI